MRKIISILTLVCFLLSGQGVPVHASPSISGVVSSETKYLPSDLKALQLSEEIGNIKEVFQGSNKKTVILIQDAHSIPDAQRNIQKIIQYFQSAYGVQNVALEGAASPLDAQIFKSFPDQEKLRKVMDEYFDRAELTGGNAAAIFGAVGSSKLDVGREKNNRLSQSSNLQPLTSNFQGIEDWDLYEEGIGLYQEAMKKEPVLLETLRAKSEELRAEKERVYTKEQLELDKNIERFYENQMDFVEVLKKCSRILQLKEGTELALILEESGRNPDTEAWLDRETRKIAGQMRAELKRMRIVSPEFNSQYQKYQTGQITAKEFALILKKIAKEKKIRVRVSKKLSQSVQKQQKLRDIEGTELFIQFDDYRKSVEKIVFRDEKTSALNRQTHERRVLEKLTRLELSREDWEAMKREEGRGTREAYETHFAFYHNSEQREAAMTENLTKHMEHQSTRAPEHPSGAPEGRIPTGAQVPGALVRSAILVAGGFHTEGIKERLKALGCSYVVVMPKIGTIPENSLYREHMQGKVSWSKYFEVENGKVSPYKAFVRATRDVLLELDVGSSKLEEGNRDRSVQLPTSNFQLAKQWRDQIIRDLSAQGRIAEASKYTRFLDEISNSKSQELRAKSNTTAMLQAWYANIDKFIDGLKKLQSQNNLTQQGISGLIHSINIPQEILSTALSGDLVAIKYLPILQPTDRDLVITAEKAGIKRFETYRTSVTSGTASAKERSPSSEMHPSLVAPGTVSAPQGSAVSETHLPPVAPGTVSGGLLNVHSETRTDTSQPGTVSNASGFASGFAKGRSEVREEKGEEVSFVLPDAKAAIYQMAKERVRAIADRRFDSGIRARFMQWFQEDPIQQAAEGMFNKLKTNILLQRAMEEVWDEIREEAGSLRAIAQDPVKDLLDRVYRMMQYRKRADVVSRRGFLRISAAGVIAASKPSLFLPSPGKVVDTSWVQSILSRYFKNPPKSFKNAKLWLSPNGVSYLDNSFPNYGTFGHIQRTVLRTLKEEESIKIGSSNDFIMHHYLAWLNKRIKPESYFAPAQFTQHITEFPMGLMGEYQRYERTPWNSIPESVRQKAIGDWSTYADDLHSTLEIIKSIFKEDPSLSESVLYAGKEGIFFENIRSPHIREIVTNINRQLEFKKKLSEMEVKLKRMKDQLEAWPQPKDRVQDIPKELGRLQNLIQKLEGQRGIWERLIRQFDVITEKLVGLGQKEVLNQLGDARLEIDDARTTAEQDLAMVQEEIEDAVNTATQELTAVRDEMIASSETGTTGIADMVAQLLKEIQERLIALGQEKLINQLGEAPSQIEDAQAETEHSLVVIHDEMKAAASAVHEASQGINNGLPILPAEIILPAETEMKEGSETHRTSVTSGTASAKERSPSSKTRSELKQSHESKDSIQAIPRLDQLPRMELKSHQAHQAMVGFIVKDIRQAMLDVKAAYRGNVNAQAKDNKTLVTVADHLIQLMIRLKLSEFYPQDGFLGEETIKIDFLESEFNLLADRGMPLLKQKYEQYLEEYKNHKASEPLKTATHRVKRWWILDPVDGTSNYLKNDPMYAVSLGCVEWDESLGVYVPVAGVLFAPEYNEAKYQDNVLNAPMVEYDSSGIRLYEVVDGQPRLVSEGIQPPTQESNTVLTLVLRDSKSVGPNPYIGLFLHEFPADYHVSTKWDSSVVGLMEAVLGNVAVYGGIMQIWDHAAALGLIRATDGKVYRVDEADYGKELIGYLPEDIDRGIADEKFPVIVSFGTQNIQRVEKVLGKVGRYVYAAGKEIIVTISENGEVSLWDGVDKNPLVLDKKISHPVEKIVFSENERFVYFVGKPGVGKQLDLHTLSDISVPVVPVTVWDMVFLHYDLREWYPDQELLDNWISSFESLMQKWDVQRLQGYHARPLSPETYPADLQAIQEALRREDVITRIRKQRDHQRVHAYRPEKMPAVFQGDGFLNKKITAEPGQIFLAVINPENSPLDQKPETQQYFLIRVNPEVSLVESRVYNHTSALVSVLDAQSTMKQEREFEVAMPSSPADEKVLYGENNWKFYIPDTVRVKPAAFDATKMKYLPNSNDHAYLVMKSPSGQLLHRTEVVYDRGSKKLTLFSSQDQILLVPLIEIETAGSASAKERSLLSDQHLPLVAPGTVSAPQGGAVSETHQEGTSGNRQQKRAENRVIFSGPKPLKSSSVLPKSRTASGVGEAARVEKMKNRFQFGYFGASPSDLRSALEFLRDQAIPGLLEIRSSVSAGKMKNNMLHDANVRILNWMKESIRSDLNEFDKATAYGRYFQYLELLTRVLESQAVDFPTLDQSPVWDIGLTQPADLESIEKVLFSIFEADQGMTYQNRDRAFYDIFRLFSQEAEESGQKMFVSNRVASGSEAILEKQSGRVEFSGKQGNELLQKLSLADYQTIMIDRRDVTDLKGFLEENAQLTEKGLRNIVIFSEEPFETDIELSMENANVYVVYDLKEALGVPLPFPAAFLAAYGFVSETQEHLWEDLKDIRAEDGPAGRLVQNYLAFLFENPPRTSPLPRGNPVEGEAAKSLKYVKNLQPYYEKLAARFDRLAQDLEELDPVMREVFRKISAAVKDRATGFDAFLKDPKPKIRQDMARDYPVWVRYADYFEGKIEGRKKTTPTVSEMLQLLIEAQCNGMIEPLKRADAGQYPQSTALFESRTGAQRTLFNFLKNKGVLRILTGALTFEDWAGVLRDEKVLSVEQIPEVQTAELLQEIDSGNYQSLVLNAVAFSETLQKFAAVDLQALLGHLMTREFSHPFFLVLDVSLAGPEFRISDFFPEDTDLPENLHILLTSDLHPLFQSGYEAARGGALTLISSTPETQERLMGEVRQFRKFIGAEPVLDQLITLKPFFESLDDNQRKAAQILDNSGVLALEFIKMQEHLGMAGADEAGNFQSVFEIDHPFISGHDPEALNWVKRTPFWVFRAAKGQGTGLMKIWIRELKNRRIPIQAKKGTGKWISFSVEKDPLSEDDEMIRISAGPLEGEDISVILDAMKAALINFKSSFPKQAAQRLQGRRIFDVREVQKVMKELQDRINKNNMPRKTGIRVGRFTPSIEARRNHRFEMRSNVRKEAHLKKKREKNPDDQRSEKREGPEKVSEGNGVTNGAAAEASQVDLQAGFRNLQKVILSYLNGQSPDKEAGSTMSSLVHPVNRDILAVLNAAVSMALPKLSSKTMSDSLPLYFQILNTLSAVLASQSWYAPTEEDSETWQRGLVKNNAQTLKKLEETMRTRARASQGLLFENSRILWASVMAWLERFSQDQEIKMLISEKAGAVLERVLGQENGQSSFELTENTVLSQKIESGDFGILILDEKDVPNLWKLIAQSKTKDFKASSRFVWIISQENRQPVLNAGDFSGFNVFAIQDLSKGLDSSLSHPMAFLASYQDFDDKGKAFWDELTRMQKAMQPFDIFVQIQWALLLGLEPEPEMFSKGQKPSEEFVSDSEADIKELGRAYQLLEARLTELQEKSAARWPAVYQTVLNKILVRVRSYLENIKRERSTVFYEEKKSLRSIQNLYDFLVKMDENRSEAEQEGVRQSLERRISQSYVKGNTVLWLALRDFVRALERFQDSLDVQKNQASLKILVEIPEILLRLYDKTLEPTIDLKGASARALLDDIVGLKKKLALLFPALPEGQKRERLHDLAAASANTFLNTLKIALSRKPGEDAQSLKIQTRLFSNRAGAYQTVIEMLSSFWGRSGEHPVYVSQSLNQRIGSLFDRIPGFDRQTPDAFDSPEEAVAALREGRLEAVFLEPVAVDFEKGIVADTQWEKWVAAMNEDAFETPRVVVLDVSHQGTAFQLGEWWSDQTVFPDNLVLVLIQDFRFTHQNGQDRLSGASVSVVSKQESEKAIQVMDTFQERLGTGMRPETQAAYWGYWSNSQPPMERTKILMYQSALLASDLGEKKIRLNQFDFEVQHPLHSESSFGLPFLNFHMEAATGKRFLALWKEKLRERHIPVQKRDGYGFDYLVLRDVEIPSSQELVVWISPAPHTNVDAVMRAFDEAVTEFLKDSEAATKREETRSEIRTLAESLRPGRKEGMVSVTPDVATLIFQTIHKNALRQLSSELKQAAEDSMADEAGLSLQDQELGVMSENLRVLKSGLARVLLGKISPQLKDQGTPVVLDVPQNGNMQVLKPVLKAAFAGKNSLFEPALSSLDAERGHPLVSGIHGLLKQLGFNPRDFEGLITDQKDQTRNIGIVTLTQANVVRAIPQGFSLITHDESAGKFEDLSPLEQDALMMLKTFEAAALWMGTTPAQLLKDNPELFRYFQYATRKDGIISFSLVRFSREMRTAEAVEVAA